MANILTKVLKPKCENIFLEPRKQNIDINDTDLVPFQLAELIYKVYPYFLKNSLTRNDDTDRIIKFYLNTISPNDWAYLNQDLKNHSQIPLDYVLIDSKMRSLICQNISTFMPRPSSNHRYLPSELCDIAEFAK